ncbi:MAG: hypothetical protein EA424_03005 [Planctomycetaceae bacterium]|nr:MAG: hypothetical protein EA424_03005 [Planctomycetaceae bacterium]
MGRDADRTERFLHHLEPVQGALEAYCRRFLYDVNAVSDVLQNAVANTFRDFHLHVDRHRDEQPVALSAAFAAAVGGLW